MLGLKNYRNSFPDYGYKVDISSGEIRKLYSRYKRWKGIPEWCPLSDQERLEFEKYILGDKKSEKKSE